MALEAAASEDLDQKASGDRMIKLWKKEKLALRKFWKQKEHLRKLRSRNILTAAKESSKLQTAVHRNQLRHALVEHQKDQEHGQAQKKTKDTQQDQQLQQLNEDGQFNANGSSEPSDSDSDDDDYSQGTASSWTTLGSTGPLEGKSNIDGPGEPSSKLRGDALCIRGVNVSSRLMRARSTNMSRQSTLSEVHDLLSLNFIFTREFIEDCFQDDEESKIVEQLLEVDVPEAPEQDFIFFAKWASAAASLGHLDFKRRLSGSSLESGSLAGDLMAQYTAINTLWDGQAKLPSNEDSYIKQSIMPMIDAVFGSLKIVQHWQRDQLPVPDGYEEVLLPDFYAEVSQLCLAVMEVKKPNMAKADIEDDARKLPCMMKIALNMLIHANVQDPTVLGFLVSGMLQTKRREARSAYAILYQRVNDIQRSSLLTRITPHIHDLENICEVFSMNLAYEAIYIPKSLGRFLLPQNQLGIAGLLPALGPLAAAKNIASTMIKSIKRRRSHSDKGKYSPLTRQSYYVYGSKVPTA
ncbi:hypothetical protein DFQ26_001226 [Actinomortierella ambigua]|nr:hypothetical protein DFQ26_001226 [Actinomortierella ambigua]